MSNNVLNIYVFFIAVCYLSKGIETNTFLSSSWDTSAKLWNLSNIQQSAATYTGHTAAVWSVIQLITGNVVTASADKTVALWFQNGQRFQTLTGSHFYIILE